MASSLYEQTMAVNQAGMNAQFNNFMMNPIGFLMQRGANIPMQYMNNPEALVQHLLNTGQMTQDQLNVIRQKAAMMGVNV